MSAQSTSDGIQGSGISTEASDARFTLILLAELRDVLRMHGYEPSQDPSAHSRFMVAALELASTYEGRSLPDQRLRAEAERDCQRAIELGKTFGSIIEQAFGGKR